MEIDTSTSVRPHGLSVFWLLALYVIASQTINVSESFFPIVERQMASDYMQFPDTGYLMLIVVAACFALRYWRNAIVRSALAPFCTVLGFALLLPVIRQLFADALVEIAGLVVTGRIGPTRDRVLDAHLAVEPFRMIWQILLGVCVAGAWYLAIKRIFGADIRHVMRRGTAPGRNFWLILPLLLYAVALPAVTGFGALVRDAIWGWFRFRYGDDMGYALAACAISMILFASRGAIRRSEFSPVYVVLAFVLLIAAIHNLIDREILNVVRHVAKEQMPWEESLPIRTATNYVASAIYQTALNLIGATTAYGVLRLAFGRDVAAVVLRVEPAEPKTEVAPSPLGSPA